MDLFKFLFSKIFLKNILTAIILLAIIIFGLKLYLNNYTHHNDYHMVPDLTNKSFEEAKKILHDREMNIVIIDTVDYNPEYHKYAIIDQNPHNNDKVKVGRKIYVKINNNAYAKVSFPAVIGKSKRQAISLLKSAGFKVGKISTQPYFAEIILGAKHKNTKLKTGSKIPKNSVIDITIGDGKRSVDNGNNDENDSNNDSQTPDASIQKTLNDVIGN